MSEKTEKFRTCSFCFRKFTYDELPDGSVVYLGICACADCLDREATENFRALLEEDYGKHFKQHMVH